MYLGHPILVLVQIEFSPPFTGTSGKTSVQCPSHQTLDIFGSLKNVIVCGCICVMVQMATMNNDITMEVKVAMRCMVVMVYDHYQQQTHTQSITMLLGRIQNN